MTRTIRHHSLAMPRNGFIKQFLPLPSGATPIAIVGIPYSFPSVAAIIDDELPVVPLAFVTIANGGPAPDPDRWQFLGAVEYGGHMYCTFFNRHPDTIKDPPI